MKTLAQILLIAPLLATLSGCGMRHLGYDETAAPEPWKGPVINASLTVNAFADKRAQNEPGVMFSSKRNPIQRNDWQVCLNIEKGYAAGSVAGDLTAVIVKTAERRGLFKAHDHQSPAYVLDGSILRIVGEQVIGKGWAVKILFGDLQLRNTVDGRVRRLPNVSVDTEMPDNSMGYGIGSWDCASIYQHVNDQLQEAVGTLMLFVEAVARDWPSPPGQPQTMGLMPPEVIQRIVRENYGKFARCYTEGVSRNAQLEGRVVTRFIIDEHGNVTFAENGGSNIPDDKVRACVFNQFKTLTFPQPKGGFVTVVYPIMFSMGPETEPRHDPASPD